MEGKELGKYELTRVSYRAKNKALYKRNRNRQQNS